MLVGAYPFEDPEDPRNFRKTIGVCGCFIYKKLLILCLVFVDHLFTCCWCCFVYTANLKRAIHYPGLCPHFCGMSPFAIKDICGQSCKGTQYSIFLN